MKTHKILILLAAVLMLSNCKKPENNDSEPSESYLIFGHFYGECIGENCVEIFKLTSTSLYEDDLDNYPGSSSFYIGNFNQLTNEQFLMADGLMSEFPMDLLNEEETVIGIPDAGDWGGLYIEIKLGDTHDFWLLDQMQSNVPAYLHPFITEVNDRISLINGW